MKTTHNIIDAAELKPCHTCGGKKELMFCDWIMSTNKINKNFMCPICDKEEYEKFIEENQLPEE